ncbi:hypothetical protein N9J72_01120 [Candidatus Gracilibacteria bacterium]|nr:hypothetical protein [Candidatus Gracilibacteria bacterium]
MYEITHDYSPTKTLTFGKYKGKSLKNIAEQDLGYLKWLYSSEMKNPAAKRKKSLLAGLALYV